jgi:hypothetical protein
MLLWSLVLQYIMPLLHIKRRSGLCVARSGVGLLDFGRGVVLGGVICLPRHYVS